MLKFKLILLSTLTVVATIFYAYIMMIYFGNIFIVSFSTIAMLIFYGYVLINLEPMWIVYKKLTTTPKKVIPRLRRRADIEKLKYEYYASFASDNNTVVVVQHSQSNLRRMSIYMKTKNYFRVCRHFKL